MNHVVRTKSADRGCGRYRGRLDEPVRCGRGRGDAGAAVAGARYAVYVHTDNATGNTIVACDRSSGKSRSKARCDQITQSAMSWTLAG